MTLTLILSGIILIAVIIIILLANSRSKLKKEVAKDGKKIKQKEHVIHALEDIMREDGKIKREANEKRKEINDSVSSTDVVELFNKL